MPVDPELPWLLIFTFSCFLSVGDLEIGFYAKSSAVISLAFSYFQAIRLVLNQSIQVFKVPDI